MGRPLRPLGLVLFIRLQFFNFNAISKVKHKGYKISQLGAFYSHDNQNKNELLKVAPQTDEQVSETFLLLWSASDRPNIVTSDVGHLV